MKKTNKPALLDALRRFGYPLLQPESVEDPNELLAALVERDDARLMEGFPVVLAHCLANQDSRLSLEKAETFLASPEKRRQFRQLVALSHYLFNFYGLDFKNSKVFERNQPKVPMENELFEKLAQGRPVHFGSRTLHPERLKSTFLNYAVHAQFERSGNEEEKLKYREELRREYYLSFLLSRKQKDLLKKKLRGESMTKTEREYFSRVVKKKLLALADPELHRRAQRALQ